ncbi:aspartate dehydrogenase [Paraburkholderia phosphatilytica]|uniref:aspartate dehydrogenase n=1 Tax=Paraburkholderia phosphatilytica TaxID=2282883 RepID=UPI000E52A258|nr:aspartate dehydrogenase [Paraburkholderia phosphatilytica]
MNVGLIGCGAIGSLLYDLLGRYAPGVRVQVVYERTESRERARKALGTGTGTRIVDSVDDLLDGELDLVVECAGHEALRNLGPSVLAAGHDLLVASVGALADPVLETLLIDAATAKGARLRIPSGALGGLDALGAAKFAGLREVRYESHKAPDAWRGTPAEALVALDDIMRPTAFYEGTARDAARLFPQNANVAAAVALAGIGFDQTKVVLNADPLATGNAHRIKAQGDFGEIDIAVSGKTLPSNPKTSMLAPHSLVRAIVDLTRTLVVA